MAPNLEAPYMFAADCSIIRMKVAIYANLQQVGKSDFSYTVPMEIGGPNALEALLLAAKTGKKVVDADLMGRAFPRVYMTIPSVMGKRVAPAAITDGDGTTVVRVPIFRPFNFTGGRKLTSCPSYSNMPKMTSRPKISFDQ